MAGKTSRQPRGGGGGDACGCGLLKGTFFTDRETDRKTSWPFLAWNDDSNQQWFQPWFPSGAGFRPFTVSRDMSWICSINPDQNDVHQRVAQLSHAQMAQLRNRFLFCRSCGTSSLLDKGLRILRVPQRILRPGGFPHLRIASDWRWHVRGWFGLVVCGICTRCTCGG